ncbi:MAG: type II glyceraldehyde-3-phosphate dehydrogenase, partial [Candidatus Methanosuratincola petrocarbonis]
MSKVRVGVAGYGVIGQRLADGVARQEDMELVGIVDVAPTLAVRALAEKGMPYKLFCATSEAAPKLKEAGIPVSGTMEDLLSQVDVMLDATNAGIGRKNKELYVKHKVKAIFQGGEKNDVAEVFFHGYANYEKGIGKDYLKLTSCNTTGLIRAVDCLDRAVGVERVVVTIIRRSADPGDTHRGVVDLALVEPVPNHQAVDLMHIMPHVEATGLLVHVPTTHGHIISVLATPKKELTREQVLELFRKHPRMRVVRIADGFNSNAALFRYARDLGNP